MTRAAPLPATHPLAPGADGPHRAGAVVYTVCTLLLLVGLFMTSGIVVALIHAERQALMGFAVASGIALACAVSGFLSFRPYRDTALLTRDGFLVVVLSWLVVCAFGALPYVISGTIPRYTDAFFETMSGFTTTGATLLADLESLPRSVLFWRCLTQWLGGMGIVVLTVAILPRLGIGGLRLMRTEAPGPTLEKLTPRVAGTAKILWVVYLGLTVAEVTLLLAAGLPLFDALTHTFSTIATGGFSPRTASVGAYGSAFVDVVVTVFMLLAAVNFSLYFQAFRGRPGRLFGNLEVRTFICIYVLAAALVTLSVTGAVYESLGQALRFAAFQAASLLTGTGFTTANYDAWPNLARAVLLVVMFVGGCSGSTAGGIKVIRVATLFKQALNEFRHLIHPQGIFTLRIGDRRVKKDILYPVAVFFLPLYRTGAGDHPGGGRLQSGPDHRVHHRPGHRGQRRPRLRCHRTGAELRVLPRRREVVAQLRHAHRTAGGIQRAGAPHPRLLAPLTHGSACIAADFPSRTSAHHACAAYIVRERVLVTLVHSADYRLAERWVWSDAEVPRFLPLNVMAMSGSIPFMATAAPWRPLIVPQSIDTVVSGRCRISC